MKKNSLIILSMIIILLLLIIQEVEARTAYGPAIEKEGYSLSRSRIDRDITVGRMFQESFILENKGSSSLTVSVKNTPELDKIITLPTAGVIVQPNNFSEVEVILKGKELGNFAGDIEFSGDITEKIPINITVVGYSLNPSYLLNLLIDEKKYTWNNLLEFKVDIKKIVSDEIPKNLTFTYELINPETNESFNLGTDQEPGITSFQLRKSFALSKNTPEGYLDLQVTMEEEDLFAYEPNQTKEDKIVIAKEKIKISRPWYLITILGIPLWIILLIAGLILIGIITYYAIKKAVERSRKYKMALYLDTLPKKSPDVAFLGKIAERNVNAYYDLNALTTHAVVAGATGGGKSISSQVIVEEALLKNIAVVVFDPTAQWSGMLRKGEDKRMLALYPKFGLKSSNARAFPGNVKQIKNAHQAIDIKKYISPGHIQIFAMNKLDPADIDTFVASAIVSIFRSGPEEYPNLRVLLVFDEVHRLLPKFGGTGKGFLQIERACREFRKWGFGVLLISQVLSDFMGEIKANINTELQMRTRDESDLNRIKTKYGEEFLQSLIKASVGVGMFVNPKYNRGKPYFISFRPILHNTRRLSDEVLEKYNAYGEIIEDLEYQIEQLEKEKVDTFDLKMELKLVKDKLMSGNFTVVDIYLEGLKPRIEKQWKTLGKQPKKLELVLVEEKDVTEALKKAKAEREKWEKEQGGTKSQEKSQIKINPATKIVKPLTLDNGMMLSNLMELKDVLPNLERDIFAIHCNAKKNDFAVWAGSNIDQDLGEKIKAIKTKQELISIIEEFIKSNEPKKEEEKKENA